MPNASDVLAATFGRYGVRRAFGVPGGGSTSELVRALEDAGIRFVLTHTEAAAGIMASATYELAHSPGVFCATLGPGIASSVNALAHASLDRTAVTLVTDAYAASVGSTHQVIDHAALVAPVSKLSRRLQADDVGEIAGTALAASLEGLPGPTHLDLPHDVALQGTDSLVPEPCLPVPATPDPADLRAAAGMLARSRHPIALIGLGANEPGVSPHLTSFLTRHRIPYLLAYKAKGAASESSFLFAGIFCLGEPERPVIAGADLLLTIGLDPVELLPRPWSYTQPVLTLDSLERPNPLFRPCCAVIGSLEATLQSLHEQGDWQADWRIADPSERYRATLDSLRGESGPQGISPARVVEIVATEVPASSYVAVDAGAHMFAATSFWHPDQPRRFLISNGLATMGYALPAAIGAALHDPEVPVIAFVGDGGLGMTAAELETAARIGARVMVVVFDDRTLSLIGIKQELRGERPRGVDFTGTDWPAVARGFGVPAWEAATEAELAQAVREAQTVSGPTLVSARVDPAHYGTMFTVLRGA